MVCAVCEIDEFRGAHAAGEFGFAAYAQQYCRRLMIIKTEHKASPPKGESYVLNATEISELLYGIPQYDQFSINFSFSNTEYYRNAKKGVHTKYVSVLRISYMRRGSMFFSREKLRSGTLPSVYWSIQHNAISFALAKKTIIIKILMPLFHSMEGYLFITGIHVLEFR